MSSPSRSDILGSPPPALLTETGQIQGQLQSPSSESAQSGAVAAIIKIQRVQQEVKITEAVSQAAKLYSLKCKTSMSVKC